MTAMNVRLISLVFVIVSGATVGSQDITTDSPQDNWIQSCLTRFQEYDSEVNAGYDEEDYRCLCREHCPDRYILEEERLQWLRAYEEMEQFTFLEADAELIMRCINGFYVNDLYEERNMTSSDFHMICLEFSVNANDTAMYDLWLHLVTSYYEDMTSFMKPILSALIGIGLIFGIPGNIFVIITTVLLSSPDLASVVDMLIGNLALIDLIVVCICFPMELLNVYDWDVDTVDDNPAVCRFYVTLYYGSFFASILMLLAIAFERWIDFFCPLKSLNNKSRGTRLLAVAGITLFVWVLGFALAAPVHIILQMYNCGYFWLGKNVKEVFIYYMVCGFILPSCILMGVYGSIIVNISASLSKQQPQSKPTYSKAKKRVIMMLVTITVLFILVWGPQMIYNVVYAYNFLYIEQEADLGRMDSSQMRTTFKIISIFGSVFNPYVYLIFSRKYQNVFRYMLCCGKNMKLAKAADEEDLDNHTAVEMAY